jgi:uncharacterized sulfatase
MYGIDENGKFHSEWAYTDIDASPLNHLLLKTAMMHKLNPSLNLQRKRPEFELYKVTEDSVVGIIFPGLPAYSDLEKELKTALFDELTRSGDPRVVGPDKEIFETYIRYSPIREFQTPIGQIKLSLLFLTCNCY